MRYISFVGVTIVALISTLPCAADEKSKAAQYWDDAWSKAHEWQKDAGLASCTAITTAGGDMKTDGSQGMPLAMLFVSKSAGQQLYVTINPQTAKIAALPMGAINGAPPALQKEPRSLGDALAAARKAGIAADSLLTVSLMPDASGSYQWMLMSTQTGQVLYVGPTGDAKAEPGGAGAAPVAAASDQSSSSDPGSNQVHLKSTVATESHFSHLEGTGAISSDLSLAVSGTAVIDTAHGKTIRTLGPAQFEPTAVALSPDSSQVAVAGTIASPYQVLLLIADLKTGQERTLLTDKNARLEKGDDHYRNTFHALAFSPDGKLLASVRGDNHVQLWNVTDGKMQKELPELKNDERMEMAVAHFSPDGKVLMAASRQQNDISRWDVAGGKALEPLHVQDLFVEDFVFLPDGKTVSAVGNGGAFVIDLANGKATKLSGMNGLAHTVAVAPDGKTLAAFFDCQGLGLWDLSNQKLWQKLKNPDVNGSEVLAFSSDGTTLATLADSIEFWDVSARPGAEKIKSQETSTAVSAVKQQPTPPKRRRINR